MQNRLGLFKQLSEITFIKTDYSALFTNDDEKTQYYKLKEKVKISYIKIAFKDFCNKIVAPLNQMDLQEITVDQAISEIKSAFDKFTKRAFEAEISRAMMVSLQEQAVDLFNFTFENKINMAELLDPLFAESLQRLNNPANQLTDVRSGR